MFETLQQSFQERKVIWIGAIVTIVLIVAVVAAVALNRPAPKVVVSNPPVELVWWKLDSSANNYAEAIANFKLIPGNSAVNIRIVEKKSTDNYYRDLALDRARGIGPDIFTLADDDLPAYKEFLSPIDNFFGRNLTSYKQNFVDLVIRQTMDRDKVFCVTSYVDTLQLYYNKDLLSQKLIARPATTWAELTRQVGVLTTKAIARDQFVQSTISLGTGGRAQEGPANIDSLEDILPMLIFQNGGQLYDYQTQKPLSNFSGSSNTESPIYKAAKFYLDFADPSSSRYSWNTGSPNNVDAFVQGKLAYIINYRSFFDEIKRRNNRLSFDVADLPQVSETNKKTFGKFNMDCLSRTLSQNTLPADVIKYQKAQDFLFQLTTIENQLSLSTNTQLPPAHRDVIARQLDGDQVAKVFGAGALYADSYYKPDVQKTEQIWFDMYQRIQYENMPLDTSLNIALGDYNSIVSAKPNLRF